MSAIGFAALSVSFIIYAIGAVGIVVLSQRFATADEPDEKEAIKQRRNKFIIVTICTGSISLLIGITALFLG